jgi:hypothetical protein
MEIPENQRCKIELKPGTTLKNSEEKKTSASPTRLVASTDSPPFSLGLVQILLAVG